MHAFTIAVLVDSEIVIPGTAQLRDGRTERFAIGALKRLARKVLIKPYAGAADLGRWIEETRPGLVFNMTEHSDGDRRMDSHITAVLDAHRLPYTGPGPKGLMLCRDKAVSKIIAQRAGFAVPEFFVADSARLPSSIPFPVVVKPRFGDASEGIDQCSLVGDRTALVERIATLRRRGIDSIICEQYVEGREFLVSMVGRRIMPLRELIIGRPGGRNGHGPRLFSAKLKHDVNYRKRWSVRMQDAQLTRADERRIGALARRAAEELELRDYGRLDVRLSPEGEWVFLEANPNPALVPSKRSFSGAWPSEQYQSLIAQITRSALRRAACAPPPRAPAPLR
jgi:D-alanine-D-alanine ligase